jgi:hypothetical protein
MGISIKLYRVSKAERIEELNDLETELENVQRDCVDLYKMTEDLGVIFLNNVDPYIDTDAIGYKVLFGNYTDISAGSRQIGGFIPTSEIPAITAWIKENNLDNFQGFSEMYDNLSSEVNQQLDDIGSPDKKELFDYYLKQLTELYYAAGKSDNSIIICSE